MLIDIKNIMFDELQDISFKKKKIRLLLARLDKIHPIISGNKLFKLHYFIENTKQSSHKTLLTFGGAYSNHLVAAAYACKESGLKSIGIVRGEEPEKVSHTLQQCITYGMQLQFISRSNYKNADDINFIDELKLQYGHFCMVPEGGYHPLGAAGASLIMNLLKDKNATHICTATGTATTLAGLLLKITESQQVISVPVIKNMQDTAERIYHLTNKKKQDSLRIFDDYHFGGYAKKTGGLINFMNDFYKLYSIPLDFVYTAKMMYAVIDKINKSYFPQGSTIVCLHTGGLQGNLSLPTGTLIF